MKMLPVQLQLNPQLGLLSDVWWRPQQVVPSPFPEVKTTLPPQLPSDPRLWNREDVTVFLRFCENEYDLPKFEYDLFQMNGKALCLLTRQDLGERCPGAGDVLHNVLHLLIRDSQMMHRHLPNSPVTPTSRYPLSPHSHPPTPTWSLAPPDSPFHNPHMHQFMPPNSVTLSPAPSIDSQTSSPPQSQEQNGTNNGQNHPVNSMNGSVNGYGLPNQSHIVHNGHSANSNHSDSDDDQYSEAKSNAAKVASAVANFAAAAVQHFNSHQQSPPATPIMKDMKVSLSQQISNTMITSWSQQQQQQQQQQQNSQKVNVVNNGLTINSNGGGNISNNGSTSAPTTPNAFMPTVKREFFPENGEPNTNGRLLWDFLQQLLNDRNQKFSDLIAWKCRDTGVFKIVDPAGLAKLWGIQKNHLSMNYDKMSRALRYYYRVNILRKVQGERHCYQFLRNPTELKNIKNISLLRQSVQNSTTNSPNNTNENLNSTNVALSSSSTSNNGQQNTHPAQHSPQMPPHHSQQQQHHQQQQQQHHQQQRPPSNGGPPPNLPQLSVPSSISAAAVAAAVASSYGPTPSSPLFMQAFHYLNTNSNHQHQPPHSPVLPPTPSEKLQFSSLKIESQDNDDMTPTDLSVNGSSEKSNGSRNGDCYPLIRNSDGITTIKLIHSSNSRRSISPQQHNNPTSPQSVNHHHSHHEEMEQSSSCSMENDDGADGEINVVDSLMPTDLRK